MECAGNGRALLPDPRPLSQPWLAEAVGTGAWTGTPLAPILAEAGLDDDAVEVVFTGLDRGVEGGESQQYERSLPLEEALRDDVLLAYGMNGGPLLPQHGFPLRLVVPGWYGMTHVKWLTRITVVAEPFTGYQQAHAYRFRRDEDDPGEPVTRMVPRALMVPPGIASFPERERTLDCRPDDDRGARLVGLGAGRVGRGQRRRRRDLGRSRRSTRPASAGRGAAGASTGRRRPATTSSAAAPATRPGTPSRTRPTGTSAATPTTASSAFPSGSSSRPGRRRASRRACRRGSSPPCPSTPRGRPSRPRTRSPGTRAGRTAARSRRACCADAEPLHDLVLDPLLVERTLHLPARVTLELHPEPPHR